MEARGFDPFGKPRQGDWQDDPNDVLPFEPATPRGFTAHEHLDGVKLIHMNGRAFDYGLGRFLSVDPFVQFPLNSQSLNPYSYVLNNPLAGTDPTGYKVEDDGPCAASRIKSVCDGLPGNMGGRSTQWLPKEKKRGNGSEKTDATSQSPVSTSDIGSPAVTSEGGVQVAQAGTMDRDLLCETMQHRCEQQKKLDDLRRDIGEAVDVADKVAVTVAEELIYSVGGPVVKGIRTGRAIAKHGDELVEAAGTAGQTRRAAGPYFSSAKEASLAAQALGFRKISERSQGQPVFVKGNLYITPDVDGHNGGVWKAADSVSNLKSKRTRFGTLDENLMRIGD